MVLYLGPTTTLKARVYEKSAFKHHVRQFNKWHKKKTKSKNKKNMTLHICHSTWRNARVWFVVMEKPRDTREREM
jgi:hypothetical protein